MRPLESIGPPALYGNPALSPDEQHVAVARFDCATGKPDIWVIGGPSGVPSQFTFEGLDSMPLWSANGSIVFRSRTSLKRKASSGAGGGELLVPEAGTARRAARLVARRLAPLRRLRFQDAMDLWILPVAGDRPPVPWSRTPFNESQGQLSPDEHWMAYVSDESGQMEVWVRPFQSGGGPVKVSTNGGIEPRWGRDGKELFYLAPPHRPDSNRRVRYADGSRYESRFEG